MKKYINWKRKWRENWERLNKFKIFHSRSRLPDGIFLYQKIQIWINFGGFCNGRCCSIFWPFGLFYGHLVYLFYGHLVYFMVILYILWLFCIFYGYFVYFMVILYILWLFCIFYGYIFCVFFPFWYVVPRKICFRFLKAFLNAVKLRKRPVIYYVTSQYLPSTSRKLPWLRSQIITSSKQCQRWSRPFFVPHIHI
jgi:hypothetical protein